MMKSFNDCKELNYEPWVEISDGSTLATWNRNDQISYNQRLRHRDKFYFYKKVFDFLTTNEIEGDYHEFGCHRVRTFRMALSEARRQNNNKMNFYAYDSFEGLPSPTSFPSIKNWEKGALATSLEDFISLIQQHNLFVDRIRTIKGFYDLSLQSPDAFDIRKNSKVSLATVDCDLYESSVPVFEFIDDMLQEGSVIFIDDFFGGYKGNPKKGVAAAFYEYRERSSWKFIKYLDVGWYGRSYIAYK